MRRILALAAPCVLAAATAFPHADTPRLLAEVAEALRQRPSDLDLLMQRGVLYLDEEYANYPQAIADLSAALGGEGRLEALIFRATAYHRTGRTADARRDLDAYLAKGGRDVRALELRAELRAEGGDRRAATLDLLAATKIAARPEQYLKRARLHEDMGQAKRALEVLEEGLGQLGDSTDLALPLIDLALRTGQPEAALRVVIRLETGAGRPEPWMRKRGEILKAAGRDKEAQAAYAQLLARIEERQRAGGFVNDTIRLEKAQALLGLGRAAEARQVVSALGPAAERLPEYAAVVRALGPVPAAAK
jgi:tetratricopeptide (TPR) repeat protein